MTNDHRKIFLSNLDGRLDTKDLEEFFKDFGTIEHIESLSSKSAIIRYSNIESVDSVLSKYRKCTINHQEIYIRRIRYGYLERAYKDTPILSIQPLDHRHDSIEWNHLTVRCCFAQYEKHIRQIRIDSHYFHAWIYFDDYDVVDRILVGIDRFQIDGFDLEIKRARSDQDESDMRRLVEKNQRLKRQIRG